MAKGAIQARKKKARAASKEAAAAKEFKFYRKSKSKPPFGPKSRKPQA